MSESATPESGALSVEQAIASLAPQPHPEPQEAQQAPAGAADEPEEPQGETSSPEEADAEPEEQAEADETNAEAEPVVAAEPPKYWSKDAKEAFANLPPELQAVVLQQEGPREEAAARAKAEAAEKSQAAQTEIAKVKQLADALADRLPQWIENFQSRWGTQTPDWVAVAQEHGVEAMTMAKLQFETEQSQLREAAQAKNIAEAQAREAALKGEFDKLQTIAPELVDPTEGPARRREVGEYLVAQGIPADAVRDVTAVELTLARKAMLWDQAQAKLAAAPKNKPSAPPRSAPVRPSAGQVQSPAQRTAISVQNRFNSKPSIDNAVALLLNKKA